MAERAVQTAKRLLDLPDPELGLLNYRATPHSAIGVPPSVALMGRLLATRLPVVDAQLKPRHQQDAAIRKSDRVAKSTYKQYYDKRHGVRELPPLQPGDSVLMKLDGEKRWAQPSTVVRRDPVNRSYVVQTGAGVNYRRNRRHLQSVPPVAPPVVGVEPDIEPVQAVDVPAEPGVQSVPPVAPPVVGVEPDVEPVQAVDVPAEPGVQSVPPVAPPVVGVEPDVEPVQAVDVPAEPGVLPELVVQEAPPGPPATRTRSGRLVRPPVRFE